MRLLSKRFAIRGGSFGEIDIKHHPPKILRRARKRFWNRGGERGAQRGKRQNPPRPLFLVKLPSSRLPRRETQGASLSPVGNQTPPCERRSPRDGR